ncbi:hypothetical protein AKL15_12925 [Corynebacterium glutamicum]|nr:hypothetical protein AUO96_05300 [Corynebacterium glutamicum]QDX76551.1 hypothetical protein AKL15_12925 [Corynebacterium glutamicum]QDX79328.1 hypothetical protein AKL16_12945 [Corynebacterium glutamicum]TWS36415.1 hypothetical protein AKJ20_04015 [Corynebacterium glutamicum]TWS36778.1 hypothetical protein AKJ19_02325 [Corynebacterium glutamicum]
MATKVDYQALSGEIIPEHGLARGLLQGGEVGVGGRLRVGHGQPPASGAHLMVGRFSGLRGRGVVDVHVVGEVVAGAKGSLLI